MGDSKESLGWRQESHGSGAFPARVADRPVTWTMTWAVTWGIGFREMPLKAFFRLCYEADYFRHIAALVSGLGGEWQ